VGTFFGKIQGVPTDYLIGTLWSNRPENHECTDHFPHQEHRKKICLENFKCFHSVLGGYRAGTLSMYSRCVYDVLGWKTGICPQCALDGPWHSSTRSMRYAAVLTERVWSLVGYEQAKVRIILLATMEEWADSFLVG
jgi:hypothetical protein